MVLCGGWCSITTVKEHANSLPTGHFCKKRYYGVFLIIFAMQILNFSQRISLS
jgi:hypothetical protein